MTLKSYVGAQCHAYPYIYLGGMGWRDVANANAVNDNDV